MTTTPESLHRDFAELLQAAGEHAVIWRSQSAVVWAQDKPWCRALGFHWYSYESKTMRAQVERFSLRWPRSDMLATPYPDALRLEFTFHVDESPTALQWLRDLCLRRDTPLLEAHYTECLKHIRAGSHYEWTDRAWTACEAVYVARARARGEVRVARPNRPRDVFYRHKLGEG